MSGSYEHRLAAAAALRALNHAFVAADGDDAVLGDVAAAARSLTERLAAQPRRDRLALMRSNPLFVPGDADGSAEPGPFIAGARPGFEDRAVAGMTNPTSVEPEAWFDGEHAKTRVVLGPAFEGAPGRAHGGIVAAVFDDVTGFIIGRLRQPSFTGELTVRFVNPVPVNEELIFAAWLDDRDGRKLYIHADARAGDTIVATCKAIYITVSPDLFAAAPDPR